jgi:pyruvate/2-oxoglutarate dehydrogenase complex dihydrolipoamide acyltransferase (E2) component
MRSAIVLPELGAEGAELRVCCWLVELGDVVDQGDRLVEIVMDGLTFDVSAERSGIVVRIEHSMESAVRAGDVLGWIETAEETP